MLAVVALVAALGWEKPLDWKNFAKHMGGMDNKPDCHAINMPAQWWDQLKERGIQFGTKEHLLKEAEAMVELAKNSEVDKWPPQWKENWGEVSKICQWPEGGFGGQWKGLECHSGVFTPPPPASSGHHVRHIILPHGLVKGTLPEGLKNLVCVTEMEIPHSKISGTLPDMGYWLCTQKFDLSYNEISGTLPNDWLPAPCVQILNLDHNKLEGTIPESLRDKTVLMSLRLSNNRFTGVIPDFGSMPELAELDLSGNLLSGTIPESILKMPKLQWLKLHQNDFTGPIPASINQLTRLSVFSVRGNDKMDATVPDSIATLPLRVFNGTDAMKCSSPTLLRHVPESTSCGGRPIGTSKGTWLEAPK
eukprot:TRINITY_DN6005_c0_g2_i3.p1 TRINITY_DN6005_c0_g2~~TRINITY_DN6005_c0_g2_i3.p1  ORF type:complete len:362 (+),score=136.39 TRINITY_DN6005_c0_g2_i3:47-1132(+)